MQVGGSAFVQRYRGLFLDIRGSRSLGAFISILCESLRNRARESSKIRSAG
jgi:hypothetical protein